MPLHNKIFHFVSVFVEFFLFYNGEVYLAWSGGKDSDVGCDIIDKLWSGEFTGVYITEDTWKLITSYSKPRRVMCNTGLEFPELVERTKLRAVTHKDVDILKPKMGFTRVISEIGVAVGSKTIAMQLRRLKSYLANPTEKNKATRILYMTGIKSDGSKSKNLGLSPKWLRLLDAPFPVSDQCCNIFKKDPFKKYEKETSKKAVIFTTTEESSQRTLSYMQTGCNSFERGKEKCRPYSIFTKNNTWEYAEKFGLRFADVYYERTVEVEELDGSKVCRTLEAEERTGCTFCMFGVHLEPKNKNNRIQRLRLSHPKYWDIVVNKCELFKRLDYINVPYKPL